MNKKTFTSLLAHPESISQKNLFGLSEIVEKYPFFQTARALHLKSLKKSNISKFFKSLEEDLNLPPHKYRRGFDDDAPF